MHSGDASFRHSSQQTETDNQDFDNFDFAQHTGKHRHTNRLLARKVNGPYFAFTDGGADVAVVSVKGGQPPIDPQSDEPRSQTDLMGRLKQDPTAREILANAVKLNAEASQFQAERARFEQRCMVRPRWPAGSG
ncbi:hypothetical protein [Paraburkholderia aspalathi]|uniref:hypothetical protein n=1 Tax=Paraburkholderia aspalathi TaxID=1324617 RepID=UPI001BA817C7|nr:hypothetical protein [Paraburkholderia aspalathi]